MVPKKDPYCVKATVHLQGLEPERMTVLNWRRGRDSNPRYPLRYVRFRGGSFQPLTHLSVPN
jgi:hypothetical protein